MTHAIPRQTKLLVMFSLLSLQACVGNAGTSNPGSGGATGSGGRTSTGGAMAVGSGGTSSTGGRTGSGGTVGGGSGGSGSDGSGSGGVTGSGGRARDGGVAADASPPPGSGGASAVDGGSALNAATQLCVDTINMYRATLGLPPYARWNEQESCTSGEALTDSQSGVAHSAFGSCTENAQDECPGWPGSLQSIVTQCLAQMWAEGPGTGTAHGHYNNMSSTRYTRAACGFSTTAGSTWATQNFK